MRQTALLVAVIAAAGCYRSHTVPTDSSRDPDGGAAAEGGPPRCHVQCEPPELVADRVLLAGPPPFYEQVGRLLGVSRVADTLAVLTSSRGGDFEREHGRTGLLLVDLRTGVITEAETGDALLDDGQLVGGAIWSEGDEFRALIVSSSLRDLRAPTIARAVYARWGVDGLLRSATPLGDFSGALTTHVTSSLGQPAAAFARGSRGIGAVIRGATVESATLTLSDTGTMDALGPLVTLSPGPDEAGALSGVVFAGDAVAVVGGGYSEGLAPRPAFVAAGALGVGPLLPTMLPGTTADPPPVVTALSDGFVVHRFVTDPASSLASSIMRLEYSFGGVPRGAQRIDTPGGLAPLAMAVSDEPSPVLAWTAREPTSLTAADVLVLPDIDLAACGEIRVEPAVHLAHLPYLVSDEKSLAVRSDMDGTWLVTLSAEPGVTIDWVGMRLSVFRVPSCSVTP